MRQTITLFTPLPGAEWTKRDTEKYWLCPVVSQARQIKVRNAEEAVEVVKLFEELQGAANYVAFFKINTKDFTVFDKQFIEDQFGSRIHWRYTPEARAAAGWTVKVDYTGPPAAVRQAPTYEVDVDDQQTFRELRWR
jgi:hypothetical protein